MSNKSSELLYTAASIIGERGLQYGAAEENFKLISDLASLRLGRSFHEYEIAVIMACVKNARSFASPNHLDSHIDAMAYESFAATFADDYINNYTITETVSYQKKEDRKAAVVTPITAKQPSPKKAPSPIDIEALDKEIRG